MNITIKISNIEEIDKDLIGLTADRIFLVYKMLNEIYWYKFYKEMSPDQADNHLKIAIEWYNSLPIEWRNDDNQTPKEGE